MHENLCPNSQNQDLNKVIQLNKLASQVTVVCRVKPLKTAQ